MERALLARRRTGVPRAHPGAGSLGSLQRRHRGISQPGGAMGAGHRIQNFGPLQGIHAEGRDAPHGRPTAARRRAGGPPRRLGRRAVKRAILAALALACAPAWAQYPAKPIRLLLTFSSGGQADLLARLVSERMRTTLGQPIVIEPRPGAGGNLAMEAVAKSPADGYTLVFGTPAVAINGKLYKQLSYDPLKDLAPLGLAAWGPYVVYASGTLPVNSIAELIAYAKAKP